MMMMPENPGPTSAPGTPKTHHGATIMRDCHHDAAHSWFIRIENAAHLKMIHTQQVPSGRRAPREFTKRTKRLYDCVKCVHVVGPKQSNGP